MGASCGSKSSADDEENKSTTNSKKSVPTVPYIVVSSVSLSRKIADEHMCLSVRNTPGPSSSRPHSASHYRHVRSARRRHGSSVTPEPTKNTILFQDEQHNNKMQVEIKNKGDVPYLTLRSNSNLEREPLSISEVPVSRVTSVASLIDSKDDVSLTSELLRPESQRRSNVSPLETNNSQLPPSQLSLNTDNTTETVPLKRSDSTRVNRLRSKALGNTNSDDDENVWWDSPSMKQQLSKAKSISAIDLLQQFKESGVLDNDLSKDDDMWKLFESKDDSGTSSPSEQDEVGETLEQVITVDDKNT